MNAPKVSFIIPVFNAEKYIEQCLISVLKQSISDIEVICIDDASIDNSLNILYNFNEVYKNLIIVSNPLNLGESYSRNRGIDFATGEYLGFIDNDDQIDRLFAETLYTHAKAYNVDIVKGNTFVYDYNRNIESVDDQLNKEILEKSKFYFTRHWWSAIYRSSIIKKKVHLPEGKPLGGDFLFLIKALFQARSISCVDSVAYRYYRRKDSGDSQFLSDEKINSVLSIYIRIISLIIENDLARQDSTGYAHIRKLLIRASLNLIPRCLDQSSKIRCLKHAQQLLQGVDEAIITDIFTERKNFREYALGYLTEDEYLHGNILHNNIMSHLRDLVKQKSLQNATCALNKANSVLEAISK